MPLRRQLSNFSRCGTASVALERPWASAGRSAWPRPARRPWTKLRQKVYALRELLSVSEIDALLLNPDDERGS